MGAWGPATSAACVTASEADVAATRLLSDDRDEGEGDFS